MTKLKIIIFMLSMLLATTGAMAQSRQSSKSRSRSSSTQKRSGNRNRSGNQNRYRNQNRSRQSSSLCPDNNHPHMIDLGLPSGTKWACCNVGADKPEAYGCYYAWGETEEKKVYDYDTYKYYKDGEFVDIGSDIAGTQYDVAHVKWGGGWRMPPEVQIDELFDNCTYLWTTFNGVEGGKFTSEKNGKSIFLRAAGEVDLKGTLVVYWSSIQKNGFAACLYFDGGIAYGIAHSCGGEACPFGMPVRPVSK